MANYIGILAKCGDVIGIDGGLVADLPQDLFHFKSVTKDATLIMGRKTVESLPFKLQGREVICLTRSDRYVNYKADDCISHFDELDDENGDIYIAGGADVYDLYADKIDTWIVTEVDEEVMKTGEVMTRLSKKTMDSINSCDTIMEQNIDNARIMWRVRK